MNVNLIAALLLSAQDVSPAPRDPPIMPARIVPARVAPRDPSPQPASAPAASGAPGAPAAVNSRDIGMDSTGGCRGNGGDIDLRRVMRLENHSLDVDGPNGPLRLSVRGEQLHIARINDPAWGMLIFEIAHALVPDGDIDIELKLAVVEGRPAVYWRETFQHTTYRQGLFSIVGEEVRGLCQGSGGIWVSH